MSPRIATKALDAILALAAAEPDREVCGLLLGRGTEVTAVLSATNVAADPRRRFEVDPAALLAAHREQRRGGPAILGCYHSHPVGPAEPSRRDADDAEPNGWLWLIVGRNDARLWRAVRNGVAHGRFDPVPFTCIDAPPTSESALSS